MLENALYLTFFLWILVRMKSMNDLMQLNVQQSTIIIIVRSFLQVIIIISDGIKIEGLAHVNIQHSSENDSESLFYSQIFENVDRGRIWKMIGKMLKMFVELKNEKRKHI